MSIPSLLRLVALALTAALAMPSPPAGAQARLVTALRPVTPAEHAARCARGPCVTRWSGSSPSGLLVVAVVEREDTADRSASLWLELERSGARWEHLLGETGRFCGGTSEGARSTRWRASELVDFHGGPEPEIFVDVHDSVHGGETSVSQIGTTVCSLEASTPSCHQYVGGTGTVAPRTFPARGHVAIGSTDFEVPFLP